MGYAIEFTYQGLAVEAEIEEYDRGYWAAPPSGGTCEDISWEVEDIDEVLAHLELRTEALDCIVRAHFRMFGHLPQTLVARLERDWSADIEDAAVEYFWHELGGPEGYNDG